MPRVNPVNNTTNVNVNSVNDTTSTETQSEVITTNSTVASTEYWYQQSKYYAQQSANSATDAENAKNAILSDAGFIAVSADLENINIVATNIEDVNIVATNIEDVNAVADDLINIGIIATDLSDDDSILKAVENNLTEITGVYTDLSNINAVYDDLTNIDTVVTNISDVNTLVTNISDVSTVADDILKVNTVADSISDVGDVADNISIISAVNSNSTNINAVADNETNINAVASNATNINAVAGNATNINAVAGNATNINAVNSNSANINTVAGISSNVTTVANNASNIQTVVTNITDIQNAEENATLASQSATNAATSEDNAEIWAEGTDSQVSDLGGTHSAKGWADVVASSLSNYVPTSSLGVSVATLGSDGKVPSTQLPSYVDDVIDAYVVSGATALTSGWLSKTSGGSALTPETDKIYVVVSSGEYQNKTYRWSGTTYVEISASPGAATESAAGIIEIATQTEVNTGTDDTRAVTPLKLSTYVASALSGVVKKVNNTSPDSSGNVTISIPTVNNSTITIQKNGTTVDSFTLNQSSGKTINISVPTDTGDLTNGAGFITSSALSGYATESWVGNQGYITGITSSDVTTALGFTPYNSSNPNGYISSAALNDLTDVTISNPSAGQNLTYDAVNGVWKNTSTSATVAWGGITGSLNDQTDLKNALDAKQAVGNYVTTDTQQTITAQKTFNTRVNFLGTGDANAIYLSTDTRIDVNGTSNTVLGFASGTFLINNAAYNLKLRGKQTRPVYNSDTNYIALLSDVPTQPSDIGAQATLVSGTNIKTINNTSLLGSGNIDTPYRNIGEIVASTIPLTDAGLHLLDGALISGSGSYSDFVDYMANVYDTTNKYSNITRIGSLTDNNGVLSGFSGSNYALLPSTLNLSTSQDYEIVFKINLTSYPSSGFSQLLYSNLSSYGYRVAIGTDGKFSFIYNTSITAIINLTGIYTFQLNTDYYIKFKHIASSNTYIESYSLDGITYIDDITFTDTNQTSGNYLSTTIGLDSQNSRWAFTGSIDLNESYININGSRWWSGRIAYGFTNETQWQSAVNTYGVCGKFVYDSDANTVRLPKITGFTEGTIDATALGDLVAAGLPNIIGTMAGVASYASNASGAFYGTKESSLGLTGSGQDYSSFTLNASRSSSIYGNSNTVQPQAIKVLYYIVVATSQKTDIQVDIDEIATDLNGKADTDLSNVNNTAKILMASMGMPSTRYTALTLTNNASYTAPANGYFYIRMYNHTAINGASTVLLINVTSGFSAGESQSTASAYAREYNVMCPALKGDVVVLQWGRSGQYADPVFRFIYAKGSESEA